jgi:hypothetical protein
MYEMKIILSMKSITIKRYYGTYNEKKVVTENNAHENNEKACRYQTGRSTGKGSSVNENE